MARSSSDRFDSMWSQHRFQLRSGAHSASFGRMGCGASHVESPPIDYGSRTNPASQEGMQQMTKTITNRPSSTTSGNAESFPVSIPPGVEDFPTKCIVGVTAELLPTFMALATGARKGSVEMLIEHPNGRLIAAFRKAVKALRFATGQAAMY